MIPDGQGTKLMKTNELLDCDNVGDAIREGRPLRPAHAYGILVAQDNLNFRSVQVTDPVPLGRQILAGVGIDPHGDYSLFAILPSGDFEDVRLDEQFDLRARGAERFVAFQTDRDFKLMLNEHQLEWGKPAIGGAALYALAKPGPDEAVFLEIRGGEDRLVKPEEVVDLTAPGIERFITAPKNVTFEIMVNGRPRTVDHQHVTFEEVVQIAFPGTPASNLAFSMTYSHAASKPHAGNLGAGGSVDVKKKGTIFNVTPTVQS
jgi:hypothetical protein